MLNIQISLQTIDFSHTKAHMNKQISKRLHAIFSQYRYFINLFFFYLCCSQDEKDEFENPQCKPAQPGSICYFFPHSSSKFGCYFRFSIQLDNVYIELRSIVQKVKWRPRSLCCCCCCCCSATKKSTMILMAQTTGFEPTTVTKGNRKWRERITFHWEF